MMYGHSRNGGHGYRRPTYEWTPSFDSARPRRAKKRRSKRHYRRSAPRRAPEIPLVALLLRYPSLSQYPTDAKITLDPAENLAAFLGTILGACVPLLFVFWQVTVPLGLMGLVIRYILRHARRFEKKALTIYVETNKAYRINRKNSVNPPPTAEALMAAWKATRGGRRGDPDALKARLRLGSMLSDLEPVVDQSYIRDADGTIVGRKPGLRGWINWHCPELAPRYKTLMAYKALSDKLRVALEIHEPDTIETAIDLTEEGSEISVKPTAGEGMRKAFQEVFGEGVPGTMAGMEAAVRARLGIVWMRRGRRTAA